MLPSPEEKQKIQEVAIANPEVPLGSAEQFLMMLSTISELPARLKLWLFKLDYEIMEKVGALFFILTSIVSIFGLNLIIFSVLIFSVEYFLTMSLLMLNNDSFIVTDLYHL